MKNDRYGILLSLIFSVQICLFSKIVLADPPAAAPATRENGEAGQLLDVENLKKKYWAKGDESGLRVVQNRLYSKAKKIELGVFAGTVSNDPFLKVKNLGLLLGYFFNEDYGVNIIYWKNFVSPSSALGTLQSETGITANTNEPDSFYGGEFTYSPVYGKLSVFGKLIAYYDFHVLAGLGITKTETGNLITPSLGIGQQFYLSKSTALRLNYRISYYKENIKEKVRVLNRGNVIGTRSTFNDVITLGFTKLF